MKIKTYAENFRNHLSTITRHKILVGKLCFRCGLYRQGLMHDLSKYSPAEFLMGVKYYQGTRSPNDAEREAKGVTTSWLHHKGRNKHHLEYWVDYDVNYKDRKPAAAESESKAAVQSDNEGQEGQESQKKPRTGLVGMKMPDNYIVEMFCDRIAASKIYQGEDYTDRSALDYFYRGRGKTMLHPYSEKRLVTLLTILAEKGEDAAFAYARKYMRAYRRYKIRKMFKSE